MSIEHFRHFSKWIQYLSSVFQYASFDTSHDYIWIKIYFFIFLNFTTGDPKFWSQNIREIYASEKKIKTVWNPLAKGYKMPCESEFYDACAGKK